MSDLNFICESESTCLMWSDHCHPNFIQESQSNFLVWSNRPYHLKKYVKIIQLFQHLSGISS
jgi:hypothetical protein